MVSTLVAQIADPCKLAPAGLNGRISGGSGPLSNRYAKWVGNPTFDPWASLGLGRWAMAAQLERYTNTWLFQKRSA